MHCCWFDSYAIATQEGFESTVLIKDHGKNGETAIKHRQLAQNVQTQKNTKNAKCLLPLWCTVDIASALGRVEAYIEYWQWSPNCLKELRHGLNTFQTRREKMDQFTCAYVRQVLKELKAQTENHIVSSDTFSVPILQTENMWTDLKFMIWLYYIVYAAKAENHTIGKRTKPIISHFFNINIIHILIFDKVLPVHSRIW